MTRLFDADWMWEEALRVLDRAERRHRRLFALLGADAPRPAWEPPADVFETDDGIWIVVALPGVAPGQVRLQVEGQELVIQAERLLPARLDCVRVRRLEIPHGSFERRIELPPGRYALREQRMADGCLQLHLTRE